MKIRIRPFLIVNCEGGTAVSAGGVETAVSMQSMTARSNTPTGLPVIALGTLLSVLALLGLGVWRRRQTFR